MEIVRPGFKPNDVLLDSQILLGYGDGGQKNWR